MATSQTPNYALPLENDDSVKFRDYRRDVNGTSENSAMNKIDSALAGKADEIEYNDEEGTLQLKSLGRPLGDAIEVGSGRWGDFEDLIPEQPQQ